MNWRMVVTVSFGPELLKAVDGRCEELKLNRSQYVRKLAEADLAAGGAFTIYPKGSKATESGEQQQRNNNPPKSPSALLGYGSRIIPMMAAM